jgi:sugar lactone lactonase YvrE
MGTSGRVAALALCAASLARTAPAPVVERIAGGGEGALGGRAVEARLIEPFATARDKNGTLYICEYKGQRVTRVDRRGRITAFAGAGAATESAFKDPHGLVIASDQKMYLADTLNHRVLRLDLRSGASTVIAGTGEAGFAGDGGPATAARFNGVYGIDVDATGRRLYVADLENRRIRMIDLQSGATSTIAGNGTRGAPQDGAEAAASPLEDPRAVAVDARRNVYVLERRGNALRVVDPQGKIRTVLGPAGQLRLNGPKHLCVEKGGSVIIADTENHRIVRFTPADGSAAVVAGTGTKGDEINPDDPLRTALNRPHGVAVDSSGALYVTDSYNHRILKISLR